VVSSTPGLNNDFFVVNETVTCYEEIIAKTKLDSLNIEKLPAR
jgi:hypothetical protein